MDEQLIYNIVSNVLKKFKVKHYYAESVSEVNLKSVVASNTLTNELSIGKIGDAYVLAVKTEDDGVVILGSSNIIPSGAKALSELTDVDDSVISATNGDVLQYNSTVSKWVAAALNVPDTLDELSDVQITTPAMNNILKYNGSSWVNSPMPSPNIPTQLYQLTDVYSEGDAGAPALTEGKVLMYKNSRWEPSDIVDNSGSLSGISFSIIPFPLSTALSRSSQSGTQSFISLFRFTAPWTAPVTGIRIYIPNSISSGVTINYKLIEDSAITYGTTLTHNSGALNSPETATLLTPSTGSIQSLPFTGANIISLTKNTTYWLYIRIPDGSSGDIGGRTITGQNNLNNISPSYVKSGANATTLELTSANIPGIGASVGFLPYFEIY